MRRNGFSEQKKISKKNIEIMGIINLVLISMLILSLHLITNEIVYRGWIDTKWFGFLIPLNLIYDLNLYAILGLIIVAIILRLKEGD